MENLFNNCSALWSDYSTKVAMSVADTYEGTGQSFSLSEETKDVLQQSLSSYGFSDNEIRDILDNHGVNENTAYKLIGFCLDKIDRKEEDSLYLLKEAIKDEYEELSEEEVWNINKCRQEHREFLNKTLNKGVMIDCSENITLKNYMGYETINEAVHGTICHAGTIENVQFTPFDKPINIDIWANDRFLIDDREEFKKLNAVGTLLTEQPIYGDIYLLVSEEVNGELDNRGFSYKETKEGEEDLCECWFIEDKLMRFINNNKDEIEKLHKEWDNNKPQPHIVVTSFDFDEIDEMEEEER